MHTLGTGAYLQCFFLLDLAMNFGFDLFQVLSVFFKLQTMLFLHVVDDIGINLLDEVFSLSQ